MKNKPIFLFFLSLLVFGFVSCTFNEQQTDVSFKIPATLCEEIFSPDVTSDDIGDSQEQEISEIQEGVQEGIQEGVQEGASEQEETDPQESEQQETDPKESEQETPEKTYFVQVRLFVNDKESKSITKTYNHKDISVTFEKIKIGDSVYAEIAFMVQSKDEETADILATGKTNTAIVEEGTTVLDAELTVKLNSGNEENPPAKTAEYTINYYLQKAEESEPDYVLEKTEHEQGEVGTTTNVTADPDAYKGFNATEITQQEIKEDDSTVVNVYYDRKIYKLEYNDGCDDEEIEVPETKTYRYGATAFIDYALGTREGFGFIGWSDGTNTYKSSEQTEIAIADADVTLTAVWEKLLSPATYTINYYLQKAEQSEPDYVLEETNYAQGEVGATTNVTAARDAYKGFIPTEITQQEIKKDNSTVVNVYYDRKIYKLEYVDGVDGETISVPQTKTYRYGATALIDYALGTREGFTFIGWSDGTNTYKSSLQTTIAISDADVTLTAVWEELVLNATYTINYYLQKAEQSNPDYVLEKTDYAQGEIGTTTNVTAARDAYKGFIATEITQKEIKKDNSTVVNVYYDRKIYKLEYNDGCNNEEIEVPQTKTYRYGATALIDYALGTREGFTFIGWSDGTNTYKSSLQTTIAIPDADVTLTAVWNEILGPTTYTASNVAQAIAGLQKDSSIVVTGPISNQTISDINAALKTLYAKNTTGQTDKCIKVSLDLSGTTGLTELEDAQGWDDESKKSFYQCYCLKEIVLPDTIETIGENAFYSCSNLESINLPETITSIKKRAFSNTKLESVVIPSKVTVISESVFSICSALVSCEIKGPVTKVEGAAFYGCSALESIALPDTITTIVGDVLYNLGVFTNCTSLKQANIPNQLTYIPDALFDGCSSLEAVEIPDTVTGIGNHSFYGCETLKQLVLPSSVQTIGPYAFAGCESLQSINIPAGVERIMKSTFSGCAALQSISLPSTVTLIEDYAFAGCASITTITIPDGVGTLPIGAFKDCTNLKTITLPSSVSSFLCDGIGGGGTFQNCSSLQSITIPAASTYLGREVFAGCSSLTSITIPETVIGINHGAFNGCSSLTTIDIPAAVASIGQGAFYGCTKLQTVTFHESDDDLEIDAMAFANCTSLKSITLPKNMKNGYEAFYGCTALESVVLPATFTNITFEMFYGCTSLKSITIPDTVKTIGQYSFRNCSSLETVYISENSVLEKISEAAFYNCEKLSTIYVPDTVTEIHNDAFTDCTALTAITVPESTTIWDGAFESTTTITRRAPKEGPGTATFTIEIQVDELSQIEVEVNRSGSKYIFEAPEDYTTYAWTINDEQKSTSSFYTFNTANYPAGIYDLTLLAVKTDGNQTIRHSYSAQIKVTQE